MKMSRLKAFINIFIRLLHTRIKIIHEKACVLHLYRLK